MRRIKAAWAPGQSNENGEGEQADAVRAFGCPYRDPINGKRSLLPRLIERLGVERNVWLSFSNTAIGATSVVESWVGHLRTWSASMLAARGSYVLSGGGIWRCNAAASTVVVSTVAPTGTSDTTGADSVPWIYLGAPLAGDVAGTIYADGSSRFDPNGYIAAAWNSVNPATNKGFDDYWIFGSIGQGDKTFSTPRADFATGFRRVYDFFLSRGIKVAAGFTCRAATSGADSWYDTHLVPGYQDVLAGYSANPNVLAGANLYGALGMLPVTPGLGLPGLQADNLHMNDAAYRLASDEWFKALGGHPSFWG